MRNKLVIVAFLIIGLIAVIFYSNLKNHSMKVINLKNIKETPIESKQQAISPTLSQSITNNNMILEITSPQNNATVFNPTITITGKTKPKAEVFIGDKELVADSQGNFSLNYQLEEGENEIAIVANDDLGNYAEKDLVINLETNQ